MSNKVVLLDLEQNTLSAAMLREIIEHYTTLYLFNCAGKFLYPLEDIVEFSGWVSCGQVVILDTPKAAKREFEYAVVVGQLMALLEDDTHIDVISTMPGRELLLDIMRSSDLQCHLSALKGYSKPDKRIPSPETIQQKPHLHLVKKYCDALVKMAGKPNTMQKLKNSIGNILHVVPEKAQHLAGMLINLKIVKRLDGQVMYRKKILKQWTELELDSPVEASMGQPVSSAKPQHQVEKIDQILEKLRSEPLQTVQEIDQQKTVEDVQKILFKNFEKIDHVQVEVIRELHDLKTDKPKDIYELRDFLEQRFPKSDIRLLLKELIEKGYIYWNGHEVVYSHEMYLN